MVKKKRFFLNFPLYGTTSKLLEGVLEEKRREIIKEWIKSGRIEDVNNK